MEDPKTFTLTGDRILLSIVVPVFVFPPFLGNVSDQHKGTQFNGILDTGATNTCISKKVAEALSLASTGFVPVNTAGGSVLAPTYMVNVGLINRVMFQMVKVTEADLVGGADLLIGMDIITRGDLVVTNYSGKTVCTFRYPSMQAVDFVKAPTALFTSHASRGRNSKCHCGSGKKYKKCCMHQDAV